MLGSIMSRMPSSALLTGRWHALFLSLESYLDFGDVSLSDIEADYDIYRWVDR
jgi:hypothetical protein